MGVGSRLAEALHPPFPRLGSYGLLLSLGAVSASGCSSETGQGTSEVRPDGTGGQGGSGTPGGQHGGGAAPTGGSGGSSGASTGGTAGAGAAGTGGTGGAGAGGTGMPGGQGGAGGSVRPDDALVIAGDGVRFDETVPPTAVMSVTSPFGPRLQQSNAFAYDFHRGVDISGPLGARINAIADGVVHDTFAENEPGSSYPSGGNVVVVRHEADVPIPFHGEEYKTYYSVYMHLRSISTTKGKAINAGARVGTMGESGATEFVHLHFETRIGTTCSLSYQIANPEILCGPSGFDPHVNPFLFIRYDNTDDVDAEVVFGSDTTTISVTSWLAELDVNSLRINGAGVDFNSRDGIDLSNMDNPSHGGVTIAPEQFISASTEYGLSVEVDNSAIPPSSDPDWTTIVEVYDIWGGGKMLRFGATR